MSRTSSLKGLWITGILFLIIPISSVYSYAQNDTKLTIQNSTTSNLKNSSSAVNTPTLDYRFKFKWGSLGSAPGQFNRPHDIVLDKQGNIYVSDRDNNRIQKFTHNGTFI